jgi:CCCH zinc finger in TRM13 protein
MSAAVEEIAAKKMKLSEEPTAVAVKHCQHWVIRKKRFCRMSLGE